MAEWRNWSGSVTAAPAEIVRPRTEAELQAIVAKAEHVRVAGTGHSFMPVCETDGTLVSLENQDGGLEVCEDGRSVWVPGGWSIRKLTEALWGEGLSLANQGDINRQAIAGAVSTATHGTGRTLGSLSTQVLGFRLVLADGSVVECDAAREPDLFQAARVSLGMIGVIWRLRLSVVPAYRLKETNQRRPLDEVMGEWDQLADRYRHAEFWNFPYTDHVTFKTLEVVDEGDDPDLPDRSQAMFQALCDLAAAAPRMAPTLQRLVVRAQGRSAHSKQAPAWRVFPSDRDIRFEEMEYEIPAANGWAALMEARRLVRDRRFPIVFPFEYRTVAADDIWLSPMSAGPCVSISFHQYARMPWREAFKAVEEVFAAHGGRPHWAKRHTMGPDDVQRLYPNAPRWAEVRRRVDPKAKFMNAHLRELFAFSL
ncbi:MAG TPA: D-arabinono-1,4-lactone oxidase [Caulobacteraceae bacterium]|nr:D-arabinono-1,4-lactone oxidase [Caulobacteraceae bacterium]